MARGYGYVGEFVVNYSCGMALLDDALEYIELLKEFKNKEAGYYG